MKNLETYTRRTSDSKIVRFSSAEIHVAHRTMFLDNYWKLNEKNVIYKKVAFEVKSSDPIRFSR